MTETKLKAVAKPGRGRPAKISREQIFTEARRLGAGELNFSRIAERLGVKESALYHRFSSREDLLNELALELAKEFSLTPCKPKQWRPWLEETALRFFDFLVANPVVLEVSNWRSLAQFGVPVMEGVLKSLTDAGFSVLDAGRAWNAVSHMAYAQARLLSDMSRSGPMKMSSGDLEASVGQSIPLSKDSLARISKVPREQLAGTFHWIVSCMPDADVAKARAVRK